MKEVVTKESRRNAVLNRYESYYQDKIALFNKARKGLSAEAAFDLASVSGLSPADMETALNKSMKTFQNYLDKKQLLDSTTSEKILHLFRLYKKGISVFGSGDAFSEWLVRPAFGLGNRQPLMLLDTITGIELVMEELVRIEYGDLA